MKPLARNEQDTNVRIVLGAIKQGLVYVYWNQINGIIIPGKPGSTKTNTAVWLANQLAANGIKLVRLDYEADEDNKQTFVNQTSHLAYADFIPFATEASDIEKTIAALYELGLTRNKKGTPEHANQFPIAIFIDEITSLLNMPVKNIEVISKVKLNDETTEKSSEKRRTMLDNLNDMMRMFRKANIKFIVMGQNWSQVGNASKVASFRNNFNTVLFHKIVPRDVKLFGVSDTNIEKMIGALKHGQMVYNNTLIHVPYVANIPAINIKAAQRMREWEYCTFEGKKLMIETKTYPRLDKRWSHTRVLAYLLNVDFKTLKHKGKYNKVKNSIGAGTAVYAE